VVAFKVDSEHVRLMCLV